MSKRFTDSEKWKDPWFCGLTSSEKLFWVYLLDNCNLAGIWQVNWQLVKFYIPDFQFKPDVFKGRIDHLNEEKWHLKKFTFFQYGNLQPEKNRMHNRIASELEKEGVSIPLRGPSQRVKDKDMELDKEKGGVGEFDFEALWSRYPSKGKVGKKDSIRHFKASVKTAEDFEAIGKALANYVSSDRVKRGFVKDGSAWFNNWRDWVLENGKKEEFVI